MSCLVLSPAFLSETLCGHLHSLKVKLLSGIPDSLSSSCKRKNASESCDGGTTTTTTTNGSRWAARAFPLLSLEHIPDHLDFILCETRNLVSLLLQTGKLCWKILLCLAKLQGELDGGNQRKIRDEPA